MPTNSVPISSDESYAWYRRLILIDFPNRFVDGVAARPRVEDEVPEWEFSALARRCVGVLRRLLQRGTFACSRSVEENKKKYRYLSNPVSHFLDEETAIDAGEFIVFSDFVERVKEFLKSHSTYSDMSRKRIAKRVRAEGFRVDRKTDNFEDEHGFPKKMSKHVIFGLRWKERPRLQEVSE